MIKIIREHKISADSIEGLKISDLFLGSFDVDNVNTHDWYRKNDLAGYEGYYSSVVYCYFTALGLDVQVEEATNYGRLDMAVIFDKKVYLFEFKVNEQARLENNTALEQIKQKKYHEKYVGKEIYLIGVEFSKTDRNITGFDWEKV